MQIIVFSLGPEKYAIETRFINGIDRCLQITKVPNVSPYIRGLANLRGNIISIMSLKTYLDIDDNSPEMNTLIFNKEEEQVGLLVDKVIEVLSINENTIEHLENPSEYITGIINKNGDIITLLEGDGLLS